jgi:hypothetical protein
MPVTELALLRFPTPTPSTPLISCFRSGIHASESFTSTKDTFYVYQQIEDPSYVYIVGTWSSPSQHDEFIKSDENVTLMEQLKELKVGVEWMFHIDLNLSGEGKGVLDAPVVAIGRHFVSHDRKDGFAKEFAAKKKYLESFAGEERVKGGWRIDGKEREVVTGANGELGEVEKEEWVLFSGWDAKERHGDFVESEGFKEYSGIMG